MAWWLILTLLLSHISFLWLMFLCCFGEQGEQGADPKPVWNVLCWLQWERFTENRNMMLKPRSLWQWMKHKTPQNCWCFQYLHIILYSSHFQCLQWDFQNLLHIYSRYLLWLCRESQVFLAILLNNIGSALNTLLHQFKRSGCIRPLPLCLHMFITFVWEA